MHDHAQTLELAAAAIDFNLDASERSRLDAALETCSVCRRQVAAMRATATILGRTSDIGTPSHVRDVVIGAALRGGHRTPGWRPLLAASLSLLVVLGGTVAFIGNRGTEVPSAGSPAPSSPTQTAVALASPTTTPAATVPPTPTTVPSASATETPTPGTNSDDVGPLRAGDVAAMASTGRLVIRTAPGKGPESAIYKTKIYPGQRVLVLDGPVDASGYSWFHVQLGAIDGWVAAAGTDGEPWLVPVRNGRIAFVRQAVGGSPEGIYTIDPNAPNDAVPLFADPQFVHYTGLVWSPDGRRLAFVATVAGVAAGSSEVYVIDADGSNLVQVTQNDVDDDSPAWSPDNSRLAVRVANVDPSSPVDSNVVVTPVDTAGVTVLGPGANPVWSPDGLQLAMTVAAGGSSRIWVQAPDASARRLVTAVAVAVAPPAWSPDGQRLVFSSSGLFLVDVASGSKTRLAAEPGMWPAWSARGRIAFSTSESASPAVFVVDEDGTALRRVVADPGLVSAPAWSPDGRRLLIGGDVPTSAIIVVDPDNGTLTTILNDGMSSSPAWQPRLP